jgi:hypothetical protein
MVQSKEKKRQVVEGRSVLVIEGCIDVSSTKGIVKNFPEPHQCCQSKQYLQVALGSFLAFSSWRMAAVTDVIL